MTSSTYVTSIVGAQDADRLLRLLHVIDTPGIFGLFTLFQRESHTCLVVTKHDTHVVLLSDALLPLKRPIQRLWDCSALIDLVRQRLNDTVLLLMKKGEHETLRYIFEQCWSNVNHADKQGHRILHAALSVVYSPCYDVMPILLKHARLDPNLYAVHYFTEPFRIKMVSALSKCNLRYEEALREPEEKWQIESRKNAKENMRRMLALDNIDLHTMDATL